MSSITELDENEIRQYNELNSSGGAGPKIHDALVAYNSRLNRVSGEGFNDDDTSTAHAVIDELFTQMSTVANMIDDVDSMIDNLIHIISTCILDKEDEIADS